MGTFVLLGHTLWYCRHENKDFTVVVEGSQEPVAASEVKSGEKKDRHHPYGNFSARGRGIGSIDDGGGATAIRDGGLNIDSRQRYVQYMSVIIPTQYSVAFGLSGRGEE